MMVHASLIEFIGIVGLLRTRGGTIALGFQELRLYGADNRRDNLVL